MEGGDAMSATEELRRLVDERGVEWESGLPTETIVREPNDALYVERPDGRMHVYFRSYLTPAQAVAATLGNEESYTRDDVESAFVSGYSLGCLPVGSDPRWDQNEQTVDEHMAELGWVRAATLGAGTCKVESMHGYTDAHTHTSWCVELSCHTLDAWEDTEPPNYCPICGARVVE